MRHSIQHCRVIHENGLVTAEMPSDWPVPRSGWPSWLWTVPYAGSQHPQALAPQPIETGANCQRYAYAVLKHVGIRVPPFRSSELWDAPFSHPSLEDFKPLDLDRIPDVGELLRYVPEFPGGRAVTGGGAHLGDDRVSTHSTSGGSVVFAAVHFGVDGST